jgi:iduronate 2-sulfatase
MNTVSKGIAASNAAMRKKALLFGALLTTATLCAAEKLNVLLIISDDLRDTVGCYGNPAVRTPNLDRLAARGVRFDRAYAQYPVCNPSRTSFLTGLRCEQTRVVNNNTFFRTALPDIVTLPQVLRQQGWHAAGYGKVFHLRGQTPEVQAQSQDFPKSWDEAAAFKAKHAGRVIEGRNLTDGKLEWCHWGMTAGSDDDQPDGQTAAHAIATIEKCTGQGKPWLVAAGFHRPHDPFISPQKYFDLYPPGSLNLYHDPTNISALKPLSIQGAGFAQAFNAFTDTERMEFLRAYYAGVSFMDGQVGRLLDTLDRLKAWDHTLVIFCGDNGYHHNERNWWNKNTLFERSCRVPLIVAAPRAKAGQACRSLVELVDLYPTVADFCGLKAPHPLAGQSLRDLLADPSRQGREAAFTLVARSDSQYGQAVRTERWRYIHWSDGAQELYDEANDAQETHDVSGDPSHADLIQDLQKRLRQVGPFRPTQTSQPQRPKRAGKSVD